MRVKHLFLVLLLLSVTTGRTLMAATIAVLPGSGGFENSDYGSNITLGWAFVLSVPLSVTDLGYFDANDGLTDDHPVGIWDSSGNLIAEGTVPAGTAAPLVDGFRFVSITPATLGPGRYTIGGYANVTSPDAFRWQVPTITTVAGLSFAQQDLYTRGDSLSLPTTMADVFGPNGYFGPDFLVTSATTVPEPGGLSMLLIGLPFLAHWWLRRQRRYRLAP